MKCAPASTDFLLGIDQSKKGNLCKLIVSFKLKILQDVDTKIDLVSLDMENLWEVHVR